jgi:hypothetical protein
MDALGSRETHRFVIVGLERCHSKVCLREDNGLDHGALDERIRRHSRHMLGWTTATFLRLQSHMSTPGSRTEPMNRVERWIGRAAAIWVHPVGAWRAPSTRVRFVLVFGYVATGYVVGILSAFFLLEAPPL